MTTAMDEPIEPTTTEHIRSRTILVALFVVGIAVALTNKLSGGLGGDNDNSFHTFKSFHNQSFDKSTEKQHPQAKVSKRKRRHKSSSRPVSHQPTNASAEQQDTSSRCKKNKRELITLAYYYPWYIKDDWSRHGYANTPELGLYGTDDPIIAEQHIEWAAAGAIDVFVVSWMGPDHVISQHLSSGLMQSKNIQKIRFCIHYESLGRLDDLDGTRDNYIDFDRPAVMERFIDDFRFLKATYFEHDQYFKLKDGRPVVPVYVTRTFRNFKRSHIQELQEAIGMKLFLIADEAFFWDEADPLTAQNGLDMDTGELVFDAYTAYNMFEDVKVNTGETAVDYMEREALPIFETWSNSTLFFPHVLPSYHDFRGHERLIGDKDGFRTQLDRVECLPKPKTDTPHMLFVTSFNEWFEGTTVEPSFEYGTTYLDILWDFKQKRQLDCNYEHGGNGQASP